VKLSDSSLEWETYETEFGGEISLLNSIVQANNSTGTRVKVSAAMTTDVAANTDVNGPTYAGNCDTDLPGYNAVNFTSAVEVWINGALKRGGLDSSSDNDVYPGTNPNQGDLKFEFDLIGSSGSPDVITVIKNG